METLTSLRKRNDVVLWIFGSRVVMLALSPDVEASASLFCFLLCSPKSEDGGCMGVL